MAAPPGYDKMNAKTCEQLTRPPGDGEMNAEAGEQLTRPPGDGEVDAETCEQLTRPPGDGEVDAETCDKLTRPPGDGEVDAETCEQLTRPPGDGEVDAEARALDGAEGGDPNDEEVLLHKVHVGRHLLLPPTDRLVQACHGKSVTLTIHRIHWLFTPSQQRRSYQCDWKVFFVCFIA